MAISMRTTISIDDKLMGELMRGEKGVSRSEAVRRAIDAYVYQKRVDEFIKLAGSRIVDLDWREAERIEMDEVRQMEQLQERHEGKRQGARRHVGVDRVLRRR